MEFDVLDAHVWLKQLVGDWEVVATMPGHDPLPTSRETVRAIGAFWIQAEGHGSMPSGDDYSSLLTLGYDPRVDHVVGSWIGSMMPHIFVYHGTLNAGSQELTLDCEGPDFADPTRSASFREVVTLLTDDHRTFTSSIEAADGSWTEIMRADYRRI